MQKIGFLLLLGMLLGANPPARALEMFSFAAGDLAGGYFAATSAICERVNRAYPSILRCSPESTPGSRYNIEALRNHQVDVAFAQSDWQRLAYDGSGILTSQGPMTELRSVMALYLEAVTIVVGPDSGIDSVRDLANRRVDIGHPGSGRYSTNLRLIDQLGLSTDDFAELSELTASQALSELCSGRIDASVMIVGHPNDAIGEAMTRCGLRIIPLSGPRIDQQLGQILDYEPAFISAAAYPQLNSDVGTYGVTATVVTRADVDSAIIQALVAQTLDGLDAIKSHTPLMADVDAESMRTDGLTAPLHRGAVAAFEEYDAAN